MSESEHRDTGLQDESAQAAYVIGVDTLAALYHRLAADGALPLSWAIQGMLDAFDGRCQLDVQTRERIRSRVASPCTLVRRDDGDSIEIGVMENVKADGASGKGGK